jgi:hypothetical protein
MAELKETLYSAYSLTVQQSYPPAYQQSLPTTPTPGEHVLQSMTLAVLAAMNVTNVLPTA